MDSAKQQLADRLKSANNILVTVSRDPSVDQLAALLGLTLLLNKQGKHSVAVFSGQVPSTIEFLEPESTIEKNTDSLRDFIIALDKNKADKLRYKVEDDVVRIFITPYKTSISQEDLEFSQGDFNVDVVVALGVKQQQDLDDAITAHGRILHDATLASINLGPDGGLGTINWHDPQASSLSELITDLAMTIGDNLLDNQIATALLTGIVAETDRFSNDKTTSQTMTASSALMAAGANQQLVASKLEEPAQPAAEDGQPGNSDDQGKGNDEGNGQADNDGTLSIDHDKEADQKQDKPADAAPSAELPAPQEQDEEENTPEASPADESADQSSSDRMSGGSPLITEPPKLGGTLSANTKPEALDPVTDPMSMPTSEPGRLLSRSTGVSGFGPVPATPMPAQVPLPPSSPAPPTQSDGAFAPPPPSWMPPAAPVPAPAPQLPSNPLPAAPSAAPATGLPTAGSSTPPTLTELEKSLNSPHATPPQGLDDARDEVAKALNDTPAAPAPIQALNAQPLGDDLHPPKPETLPTVTPKDKPPLPLGPPPPESSGTNPQPQTPPDSLSPSPQVNDPTAPPPVPPPMPFQFGNKSNTPPNQSNTPL